MIATVPPLSPGIIVPSPIKNPCEKRLMKLGVSIDNRPLVKIFVKITNILSKVLTKN